MGLLSKIFGNTRKPEGFFGRLMVSGMNGKWEKIIDGMHIYTPDELQAHLTATGFRNVTIHRDESRHWLAAIAQK